MAVFYIKRNDTSPALQVTLKDGDGVAVNVTGATVVFHMVDSVTRAVKVNAAATIVTAASGIVKYSWAAADTNAEGTFEAEFQVTFASGLVETYPNGEHITVRVTKDLA